MSVKLEQDTQVIAFNKPYQVLCQFSADGERKTLKHFLNQFKDVYPAGRLDFDSEGLLLLTNQGKLQHQLSHPRHEHYKSYWVQIEGQPCERDLDPLRQGITLKDGPCRPAQVTKITEPESLWPRQPPIRERKHIPTTWLNIRISEGRNRQVRRMTAAIGFPTLRLIRHQIADVSVGSLAPGEWRKISLSELTLSQFSDNLSKNSDNKTRRRSKSPRSQSTQARRAAHERTSTPKPNRGRHCRTRGKISDR